MAEQLILVDLLDREIGSATKEAAHERPLLHRAFSVFLYSDDKILIQQRAMDKYHSGGLWANTCCSHPRVGEGLIEAANRRLQEEMGIKCQLRVLDSFVYYHQFSDHLFEYEYDYILIGRCDKSFSFDPAEVACAKWVDISYLLDDLRVYPQRYCAWFPIAAPKVLAYLG